MQVTKKVNNFWCVKQCRPMEIYSHFGVKYYRHLHPTTLKTETVCFSTMLVNSTSLLGTNFQKTPIFKITEVPKHMQNKNTQDRE